ncbi:uncharacterized protein [Clytia hemisphaerica]
MNLKATVFFWKYTNRKSNENPECKCNDNEKVFTGSPSNHSFKRRSSRSRSIKFSLIGRSGYYKDNLHHQAETEEADSADGGGDRDIPENDKKKSEILDQNVSGSIVSLSNQNDSTATTSPSNQNGSRATASLSNQNGSKATASLSNQNGSKATTSEEVNHISIATEVYNHSKKEVCERHQELISHYCMPLVKVEFAGQSNSAKSDKSDEGIVLNLGLYLSLLDRVIRKYKIVKDFTVEDEEFKLLLKLVASKRKLKDESTDMCFERLWKDSQIFEKIYHTRGETSEYLGTAEFWGTRQQLLCGKVIADWVNCHLNESIDPIFGALLCPCGGRVGPGDSGWVHSLLYDDRGFMAYHAAVHDAFGYLITFHKKGPGYDYLKKSVLSKYNPFSGQYDGISFWKKVLGEQHGTLASEVVGNTFGLLSNGNVKQKKVIC